MVTGCVSDPPKAIKEIIQHLAQKTLLQLIPIKSKISKDLLCTFRNDFQTGFDIRHNVVDGLTAAKNIWIVCTANPNALEQLSC